MCGGNGRFVGQGVVRLLRKVRQGMGMAGSAGCDHKLVFAAKIVNQLIIGYKTLILIDMPTFADLRDCFERKQDIAEVGIID